MTDPPPTYLSQNATSIPTSSVTAASSAIDNHDIDSSSTLSTLGHAIPPDEYWHYHHHHPEQVSQLAPNYQYGSQLDFQPSGSNFSDADKAPTDNLVVETSSYYHHFTQQDHHLQQVPWPSPTAQQECFYQQHQQQEQDQQQQQQQNVDPLPSFPAFCFDPSIDFSNPGDIFQFDKAYEAPYQESATTAEKFHFEQHSPRDNNNDEAYFTPQQQQT